ncbi:MAG: KH domain-containing protein [Coriobacteriia bacterium]|nr:KH domain-containing protein [Coriobacteriia bacterium]
MSHEVIKEGPSVADAVDAALEEMGVQQDAVAIEVLSEPGKGIFGGSGKPARVRVWLKEAPETGWDEDDEESLDDEQIPMVGPAARHYDEARELTDDELDAVADAGAATIQELLKILGMEATIEEYEGDEAEIILDIVGDDLGILIGRHGRTLDALQILVSAITNRKLEHRYPLVVDVSGYRHRRRVKLEEIARRGADRAARQRRAVELRPMTSFERRVIHVALRDDKRVTTESEGDEPRRMVVIHPS